MQIQLIYTFLSYKKSLRKFYSLKRSILSKRLQLIYHPTRTHIGINWKPLQRVLGVLIPHHVYHYVCALYLPRPSNRPINFHQTSAPPSRNIATSHSSGVRKFHTWPASPRGKGRGGIVEAWKIGSSHLQIEFDSSGGLTRDRTGCLYKSFHHPLCRRRRQGWCAR